MPIRCLSSCFIIMGILLEAPCFHYRKDGFSRSFPLIILPEISTKINRTDFWTRECVESTHGPAHTHHHGETSTNHLTFKQVPCSNWHANACRTPGQMGSVSRCAEDADAAGWSTQPEEPRRPCTLLKETLLPPRNISTWLSFAPLWWCKRL